MEILILDIETTGFNTRKDKIVEIGIVSSQFRYRRSEDLV